MAANESAAQELLARAAEAGITPEQIADKLHLSVRVLDVMSGRNRDRVQQMVNDAHERVALLDRIEFLANRMGYDGKAKRAAAEAKMSRNIDLTLFVGQCEDFCRTKGIDVRSGRTATQAPATHAQVNYIVRLLAQKAANGTGDGFMPVDHCYRDGNVDRAAVAKLTKNEASTLIASLTNNY